MAKPLQTGKKIYAKYSFSWVDSRVELSRCMSVGQALRQFSLASVLGLLLISTRTYYDDSHIKTGVRMNSNHDKTIPTRLPKPRLVVHATLSLSTFFLNLLLFFFWENRLSLLKDAATPLARLGRRTLIYSWIGPKPDQSHISTKKKKSSLTSSTITVIRFFFWNT